MQEPFFNLDLQGSLVGQEKIWESEEINTLQKRWFGLPRDVRALYGPDKDDPFFGELDVGENGVASRNEDYDVSGSQETFICLLM